MDSRFALVEERINVLEHKYDSLASSTTDTVMKELDNRKKREKNVIFSGVPDSNSDSNDLCFMVNMLKSCKDEISIDKIKLFRLGRYNKKQERLRLLNKVHFTSSSNAQWLLFNFKKKNINNDILCKPDSTPLQR